MTGEAAAPGTQAAPAAAPQAGTPHSATNVSGTSQQQQPPPPPQAAESQEQPPAGASEAISLDEAKKLRSEAQSLRRRLKEFEDAQRAADEASLSEAERLKRRVAELEAGEQSAQAALRTLRIQTAIEREAARKGFADPGDAYRLLDLDTLELDDDGRPRNAESLLNALAKAKPYLVRPESPPPPVAGAPAPLPVGATPRPTNGAALSDAEMQRRRELVYGRARAAL